jgi:hypothetical protein
MKTIQEKADANVKYMQEKLDPNSKRRTPSTRR